MDVYGRNIAIVNQFKVYYGRDTAAGQTVSDKQYVLSWGW